MSFQLSWARLLGQAVSRLPSNDDQTAKTNHMLERVIEEGFDGILIVDEHDLVLRLNGNARRLLGITQSSVTGCSVYDLLTWPIVEEIRSIRRAIDATSGSASLRETETEDHTGERRWLEFTVTQIDIGQAAGAHLCITLRDITDRHRADERIREMAMRDSLTGLLNRRGLAETVLKANKASSAPTFLTYIDLDRFKAVNDSFGHGIGDELLVQVARRASRHFRREEALTRLGGDEFAALSSGSLGDVIARAESVLEDLRRPFSVFGRALSIGASIGVSTSSAATANLSTLLQQADVALYSAKARGGQQIVVFDRRLEQDRHDRLALERDLSEAVERGEMRIMYQPQVIADTGELVGVEALMRWHHPRRGLVPPNIFIPVAEETGVINSLTKWLISTACVEAAAWPSPIGLSVNVSSVDLQSGELPKVVGDAMKHAGLAPGRLELEVTETAFIEGGEAVEKTFNDVRALGVEFALDDFGTGYSSLGYLHRFPFAKLKIDRSFVGGIPADKQAMAILRAVVLLARGLGLTIIAEGIETEEQRHALRLLGCQYAQGYLFSKPINNASLQRLLMFDSLVPSGLRGRVNAAG